MTRKSLLVSAAVAAALATGTGTPAVSHGDDREHRGRNRTLKADLSGFNEAPSTLSTAAKGSFRAVVQKDETEIRYRLDYRGLEGAVTQAHIHLGAHHQTGGISVWLCGTAALPGPVGTPLCGPGGEDGPEAEGVLTMTSVIGPSGQGIAAGEFEELVRAIKEGVTYVNVHSSLYPPGEIRGQIKADD
jgi:hypothetical protein